MKKPGAQGAQVAAPDAVEKDPAAQGAHEDVFPNDDDPGAHATHDAL